MKKSDVYYWNLGYDDANHGRNFPSEAVPQEFKNEYQEGWDVAVQSYRDELAELVG